MTASGSFEDFMAGFKSRYPEWFNGGVYVKPAEKNSVDKLHKI